MHKRFKVTLILQSGEESERERGESKRASTHTKRSHLSLEVEKKKAGIIDSTNTIAQFKRIQDQTKEGKKIMAQRKES